MKVSRRVVLIYAVCILVLVLSFTLRINTLYYNGEGVKVFALTSIADLWPADGQAITLENYTAKTPYGNIYIKAFTKVNFTWYRGTMSFLTLYNPKNVSYELSVLGNEIKYDDISFGFYENEDSEIRQKNPDLLHSISSKQEVRVGEYLFHMRRAFVTRLEDYEKVVFVLDDCPDSIYLSDGTEIINYNGEGNRWGTKHLTISSDGIWEFLAVDSYFHLKRPGWSEGQKYHSVRFKADWGQFIDGEEHTGRYWLLSPN